jgi:hypothetical protein
MEKGSLPPGIRKVHKLNPWLNSTINCVFLKCPKRKKSKRHIDGKISDGKCKSVREQNLRGQVLLNASKHLCSFTPRIQLKLFA